jgi:glycosyltransferase involved in cell wall biosynthesis
MTLSARPRATLAISTKNRVDELRLALESVLKQTAPLEILVLDDGSTDRTADLVRGEFPQVKLHRFETSEGYIVRRNQSARFASSDILFSIDDDCILSTPYIVEQALADFEHPRIGVVAIPFINVRRDSILRQAAPERSRIYVTSSYGGGACAIHRDLFLHLGGYRAGLFHQGEEMDFSLRMLQSGYVVRAGRADAIHHLESPKRDLTRLFHFNSRNNVRYAWHNVPMPDLALRLAGMNVNLVRLAVTRRQHFKAVMTGIGGGYVDIFRGRIGRRPVPSATYRLLRYLQRNEPVPLEGLEDRLPPLIALERMVSEDKAL